MPDLRRSFFTPALLAVFALVAWIPPIPGAGFSFDDREVLFDNPVVEASLPWTAAFDRDYWHHRSDAGHYRPLATLSLRLDRGLYGENATGYRWTNALLHASVVFLAALFWRRIDRRSTSAVPIFGLVLFACHPLLADAVAWISGRTSMLSALGGLLGVHLALFASRFGGRGKTQLLVAASGAFLATLLAMLSKEDGFVFGLLCLWILANDRRALLGAAAGSLLGLTLALFLRQQALGAFLPSAPHAPLANAELLDRVRTGGLALLEGLRLTIVPLRYPPQYSADSLVPGITSVPVRIGLAVLAWALVALCLFSSAAIFSRKFRQIGFGAAPLSAGSSPIATGSFFLALSVLPLMQLIPAGEIFAPRWAYLPLFFAAPLFSAAWARSPFSEREGALACGAFLLLLPLCWSRAGVYESRAAFRRAVLEHRPGDAPSWNDLGIAFWEEGEEAEAIRAWERASRLDAEYSRPQTNLGNAAMERGELQAAILHYSAAAQRGPSQPLAHLNLCNALRRAGDLAGSILAAERAVALAPGMGAAHRAQARTLHALGDAKHALEALERALTLDPADELSRKLQRVIEREMLISPP